MTIQKINVTDHARNVITNAGLDDDPLFIHLINKRFQKSQKGKPVGAYPIKKLIKEYLS